LAFRLLDAFQGLFDGKAYLHRNSTLGDHVAMHLFEDIHATGLSPKFNVRVAAGAAVINSANTQQGIRARRGDGTLGQIVPGAQAREDAGYVVKRGPVATIEIGVEVKILHKAMIKQIDRVISDLTGQAATFRKRGGKPICVGVVGINRALHTTSYEGDRPFSTDGRKHKHPIAEADEAERRLLNLAAHAFDEFIILRYAATNEPPFAFSWANAKATALDYGASLARIAREYETRV
jgi:hypothetical protein